MENQQCPQGHPLKVVPAGVSKKTGKPYSEFTVCSQCDWKPARTTGYVAQSKTAQITQMQENKARLIGQAQDRKEESISKFNSLNAAVSLVCHHELYKLLTDEELILKKIFELQKKFYDHNSQPFF